MKKNILLVFMGILLMFVLAACGEKSQADVVSGLNKKLEGMSGYKTKATMTLQTGNKPEVYEVDIWHKKEDLYRVHLNNDKKQSQIILRNKEGVFVLTPALNKSFRFQSEWPQNSSQAYLYESLVNDILKDDKAVFKATKENYIFVTKTNYQNNKTLPKQEIVISKKTLAPIMVKVMDQDDNALVQVDFTHFKFDAKFDEGAFDMKRNMTGAQIDTPTMANTDNDKFALLYPTSLPEGVEFIEEKVVSTANDEGKRFVLTYAGKDKSFTIYQEKAAVLPASAPIAVDNGDPVDLGFAVGALTENSLSWEKDGVSYYLASSNLTKEEMIEVASSVQGQETK